MPFQHDADIFTDRAMISAGDAGQIVIHGFGDMDLYIAVALGAAGFFGCGFRRKPQGRNSSGTFGHGGSFPTTPHRLRVAWPQLPLKVGWGDSRARQAGPYFPLSTTPLGGEVKRPASAPPIMDVQT